MAEVERELLRDQRSRRGDVADRRSAACAEPMCGVGVNE